MGGDARASDSGSPAPLRATEIQLKATIGNKNNGAQIHRVFTVLPFISIVDVSPLRPSYF